LVVVVNQTARTEDEAVKLAVLVQLLDTVEQTRNHIVTARSLYDQAVAIGPMIMMKFATLTCKKLDLPVIVSLNTLMVDGTGMCGACRVTVAGKTRFACVEGPEFNGYDVDFDEAMRRQGMYKAEENDAMEDHKCRIGRGR
ncbi:MAG: NAD-binding oxidoreductase, partial [Bacteroidales bacterium]|nr:NAD-binding oxidoreductase [Bacteroidales bacterium]